MLLSIGCVNMFIEERPSIAGVFYGSQEIWPYETEFEKLDIIPASSDKLQKVEQTTNNDVPKKVFSNFDYFLNKTGIRNDYDFIIIDTPPSKGPLTRAAIKCASHLIIPTQLERFSIEGIFGMLQLYKQEAYLRNNDNPITLVGIVPNQLRDISLHYDFLEDLKQMKAVKEYVVPHFIKKRTAYSEVLLQNAEPKSIFDLNANRIERKEMSAVCDYCIQKVMQKNNYVNTELAKIITCPTNKGGEGKTTLCIHLAEYIVKVLNKKVLLIDFDPQANLSSRYLMMELDPISKECKIPPVHPSYHEHVAT